MKVYRKRDGEEFYSSSFSHGYGIIVTSPGGDMTVDYASHYEVELADGRQMDLMEAFHNHDLIPDIYDINFREPLNEEEREQGYY